MSSRFVPRSTGALVAGLVLALTTLLGGAGPALAQGDAGTPQEGTWLVPVLLGGAVLAGVVLIFVVLSRRGGREDPPRRRGGSAARR